MRRFIHDREGAPRLYLTGGGAFYALDNNQPIGRLQDEQVVDYRGETLAWFDGEFLWDAEGKLLGFVKGAKPVSSSLTLPNTKPLTIKPEPTPAPYHPLLKPREKPPLQWVWSEDSLELLGRGAQA